MKESKDCYRKKRVLMFSLNQSHSLLVKTFTVFPDMVTLVTA